MSGAAIEWIALADVVQPQNDPVLDQGQPTTLEPADRRLFNRLTRATPAWTVVPRAHEPFAYPSDRKLPVYRPPGTPRVNHEFDLFAAPPPQLDWRQRTQIATPLDQGPCNCCSAFAIAGTMTDLAAIRAGSARAPLSPGHLHWCLGGGACPTALTPDSLAQAATQHPVALLQPNDYPYNPAACPAAHGTGRLAGHRSLFTANDAVQALQLGPIVGVMDLYDDFWSHYGGGVYHRTSSKYLNTHSIEIIGYDGPQQCWIIKNSEGSGWGEGGGFARIAFGECRIFTSNGHGGLALQLA